MIAILINGIGGQMGRAVYAAIKASDGAFSPAAGVDPFDCQKDFDCPVYRSIDDVKEHADVVIDFSVPAALPAVLRYAQNKKLAAVIGTTALGERDKKLLETASERIPVFQTGNMSVGVSLQLELAKTAKKALGNDFDVEIIEKHHRKKVDAPSGTALMLANAVSSQCASETAYEFGRHEKNKRRTETEIGIHSIRGGTLPGEHEVLFLGNDEVIALSHTAYSKQVFVRGALRAARFLVNKGPGLYNMQNVVTECDVASHLYSLEDQAVVILDGLPSGEGILSRIFAGIAERNIFIDMIAVSAPVSDRQCVGFSVRAPQLAGTVAVINAAKASYCPSLVLHTHPDMTKLTVEGSGMALRHGVAALLFSTLDSAAIKPQLITTSETKIEFCVDAIDAPRAVHEIEERFLKNL